MDDMTSDLERGWERELRLVRADLLGARREIARLQLMIAEVVSNLQDDDGQPALIWGNDDVGASLPEDLWTELVVVAQDLERLITTPPLGDALRELVAVLHPDEGGS